MPYIKPEDRDRVDTEINYLASLIRDDGTLNYVISRLVAQYFAQQADWGYSLVARAVGCLECVKMELYRRIAGPYENLCIRRNGDVRDYACSDVVIAKKAESLPPPLSYK